MRELLDFTDEKTKAEKRLKWFRVIQGQISLLLGLPLVSLVGKMFTPLTGHVGWISYSTGKFFALTRGDTCSALLVGPK